MLHQRTNPNFFSKICVEIDTNMLFFPAGRMLLKLKVINQYDVVLVRNVALITSAKLKKVSTYFIEKQTCPFWRRVACTELG